MLLATLSQTEYPMTGSSNPNYIMGNSRQEYERLRQQARVLERFTTPILD
jgi:hypothetical protein